MMGALEVYARAGQAVIVSPFIVGGAMAPVSVAGTLTQVLAEAMTGIAYAQLVNPGCPVIFGAFVTSIDMNSGAPTFGTPEASKILWGAGQLARRHEPAVPLGRRALRLEAAGRAGGLRERQHAAGGAARRGQLHAARLRLARGRAGLVATRSSCSTPTSSGCCTRWPRASISARTARRWMRSARWGRAGTISAAPTPRRTSRTRSGGARCSTTGRSRPGPRPGRPTRWRSRTPGCRKLLAEYEPPPLDPGVAEALKDYVARRKASEPDAFDIGPGGGTLITTKIIEHRLALPIRHATLSALAPHNPRIQRIAHRFTS